MMRKILLTTLLIPLIFINIASAASIGVNLGSDRSSLDPAESAGVVSQANWNNGPSKTGSISGLIDDTGASTTADAAWRVWKPSNPGEVGGGTWSVPGRGIGGSDSLMCGYIDPVWGDFVAEVTLSNIPYAQYDVYVYFGSNNAGGQGQVTDGTTTYSYTVDYTEPNTFAGFIQTTATDTSVPVANYAKFSGLTSSSVTLTTSTYAIAMAAGLMGVQVVGPSTICYNPNPADGAYNVPDDTDLYWYGPTDADGSWTYEVTFDGSYLTTVGGAEPNVPNSVLGTLDLGEHTWRVDAIDPAGPTTRTGDTWTFNVGIGAPTLVSPADGTGDLGLDITLEWTSDNSLGLIDHHRLILDNVTDDTSVTVDSIPVGNNSYDLGDDTNPTWDIMQYGLIWEKQYTWQIIEVGAGDEILAVGPKWSFSISALQCSGFTVNGDLTGDCKVTLDDIALVAAAWLDCGWQLDSGAILYPEKDPCLW